MKVCSKCQTELSPIHFGKRKDSKDGLRNECKLCRRKIDKKYRFYNKDQIQDRQKKYYQSNKEVFFSNNAKRRAKASEATPDWLKGEHKAHMKRTYKLASLMREITGLDYHVDHIVPLNGSDICGLHVPWNLQVLRADLNLSKSNKFEGDAP
jgi:hypothetical protein